jgi:hypothetical protein
MKPTHKLRAMSLEHISAVVSAAPSLVAAAKQLGVDRTTLHRWIAAGKVKRRQDGGKRPRDRATANRPARRGGSLPPAAAWARRIRGMYDLSVTELALVALGERMLAKAHDDSLRTETQIAASARWQSIVKQLNLEEEAESDGQVEDTVGSNIRPWPRRVS